MDRKYETLGDIAAELKRMKDDGMTLASIHYCLGRVFWDQEWFDSQVDLEKGR